MPVNARGPQLRIWTPADLPIDELSLSVRTDLCVEWLSPQAGHPSSYGLLGGTARVGVTQVPLPGGRFAGSLAGIADSVEFGLADPGNRHGVEAAAPEVVVTIAAEGRMGSSAFVFYALATFLDRAIDAGLPSDERAIWQLLDDGFTDARTWSAQNAKMRPL